VQLHHLERGQGNPVILLHGLFGSAANLGMVARALAEHFHVYSLDLRNHGLSPRSDSMSYPEMASDVAAFLNQQGIDQCAVLGHSMGGKIAMQLALDYPQRVRRLVIADIAPVAYEHDHQHVLDGLAAVAEADFDSRREANEVLAQHVDEAGVRAFLLKSLQRNDGGNRGVAGGHWKWLINRHAIDTNYARLAEANVGAPYPGPALFISGGLSEYVRPAHQQATLALFPQARLKVIEGTGHWLHAEKPAVFNKLVLRFLLESESPLDQASKG
jgi:esterase